MEIFAVIIGVGLLTGFFFLIKSSQESDIREWAEKNGFKILQIDQKIMDYGPFSFLDVGRHNNIYRVSTTGGAFWFRFGFTMEVKPGV